MGDLKASLINCPEKNIHKTSSNRYWVIKSKVDNNL